MIIVPKPPVPSGTPNQRVDELYRYLLRLTEELQVQLNAIDLSSLNAETQNIIKR